MAGSAPASSETRMPRTSQDVHPPCLGSSFQVPALRKHKKAWRHRLYCAGAKGIAHSGSFVLLLSSWTTRPQTGDCLHGSPGGSRVGVASPCHPSSHPLCSLPLLLPLLPRRLPVSDASCTAGLQIRNYLLHCDMNLASFQYASSSLCRQSSFQSLSFQA